MFYDLQWLIQIAFATHTGLMQSLVYSEWCMATYPELASLGAAD
jgi:hypothetical protein